VTRLRCEDIQATAIDMQEYDADLQRKTGTDLGGLARGAAGIDEETFKRKGIATTVAVVPVTTGYGIIPGFSEAVMRILAHIGLSAFVTAQPDVAGLTEAYQRRCGLIFLADDNSFDVINTQHRAVVSNADATGIGYAWGLNKMVGGVEGKPVLVIGCGPVGRSAATKLLNLGAVVCIHDTAPAMVHQLVTESPSIRGEEDLLEALMHHTLIVDATPAAGIIDAAAVGPATFISAPGVPIGLTTEALKKISGRLLHDSLEIGVATMAAIALESEK
jgi:pyrrolysine biosynthesis protein PylD